MNYILNHNRRHRLFQYVVAAVAEAVGLVAAFAVELVLLQAAAVLLALPAVCPAGYLPVVALAVAFQFPVVFPPMM